MTTWEETHYHKHNINLAAYDAEMKRKCREARRQRYLLHFKAIYEGRKQKHGTNR